MTLTSSADQTGKPPIVYAAAGAQFEIVSACWRESRYQFSFCQ